jgi:hypothetical protein
MKTKLDPIGESYEFDTYDRDEDDYGPLFDEGGTNC